MVVCPWQSCTEGNVHLQWNWRPLERLNCVNRVVMLYVVLWNLEAGETNSRPSLKTELESATVSELPLTRACSVLCGAHEYFLFAFRFFLPDLHTESLAFVSWYLVFLRLLLKNPPLQHFDTFPPELQDHTALCYIMSINILTSKQVKTNTLETGVYFLISPRWVKQNSLEQNSTYWFRNCQKILLT